jgi:hypothetical protein
LRRHPRILPRAERERTIFCIDIDLPLAATPAIECRTGGANGDHTLVFTFLKTLTSVGSASVTNRHGQCE